MSAIIATVIAVVATKAVNKKVVYFSVVCVQSPFIIASLSQALYSTAVIPASQLSTGSIPSTSSVIDSRSSNVSILAHSDSGLH